jgi:hypothetical protein
VFEFRDLLLHSFPETFSVPKRFAKHMMVVADIEEGNADAVDGAMIGAWSCSLGSHTGSAEELTSGRPGG